MTPLELGEIETDEGLTGVSGPMFYPSSAFYIDTSLKKHLIGEDPLKTEYHWDVMYRSNLNARAGEVTAALSMVDVALWDLKGKFFGQPVCNLLGGPVQDQIPCYASALCCSMDPERVDARVREFMIELGFFTDPVSLYSHIEKKEEMCIVIFQKIMDNRFFIVSDFHGNLFKIIVKGIVFKQTNSINYHPKRLVAV